MKLIDKIKKMFKSKKRKKKSKGPDVKIQDPSAFPTGTEDMDERIENAKKDNRWLNLGEYSEEWHNVVLLSINGLTGLSKITGNKISAGNTGGVKSVEGKDVPIDDVTLFIDGLDYQMKRLDAIYEYLEKYDLFLDGKPIRSGFKDDFGIAVVRMKDIISSPGSGNIKDDLLDLRDGIVTAMEMSGFKFKIEKYPIVGDKYKFEKELLFVGK